MDLPTCPSCGQSVLDDDVTDCPFCGAAMDGSSPAKKKPAAGKEKSSPPKAEKPAKKKAEPDEDDPFAMKQSPAAAKAIQCARKPVKGRLHRVICPMCDTPGFVPKSAIGRQVKCANKECLVPVFTAEGAEGDSPARAPARISDEEVVRPAGKPKAPSGTKNSMVIYGIVGVVLLAGTLGAVWYLNQSGPDQLGPANIDFSGVDSEDNTDNTDTQPKNNVPDTPDHQKTALEIVDQMISAARVNNGNRDKAYCRRQTADAYLRLGMTEQADAEFSQMKLVARQARENKDFFRIGPMINSYWAAKAVGDADTAAAAYQDVVSLHESIPATSGVAQESTVALAAAMIDVGDTDQAVTLLAKHRRQDIASQQDAVRLGAWTSCSEALWEAGLDDYSPFTVFSWSDPLTTAAGVHLATHKRWDAAVKWAAAQQDAQTAGDIFAAVADLMIQLEADQTSRTALLTAAGSKDPMVALRANAALARDPAEETAWNDAVASVSALTVANPAALGSPAETLNASAQNLSATSLTVSALADFAIAAAARNDQVMAKEAVEKLAQTAAAAAPPTVALRRAGSMVERSEEKVKQQLAEELTLRKEEEIRTTFFRYRRVLDQIAVVAEQRRLLLLRTLARILQHGGGSAVAEAVAGSAELKQEIGADHLDSLLFVAAASEGVEFPDALTTEPDLRVPVERMALKDLVLDLKVTPALTAGYRSFASGGGLKAVNELDRVRELSGFRTAMAVRMAQMAAKSADSPSDYVAAVLKIQEELWREPCLLAGIRILADRGLADQTVAAVRSASLLPTQRVAALHAVVVRLAAQAQAE